MFPPEELALLKAIHAAPAEDTVRLVYADWLEEHDLPEHAEFIRLQCVQPYIGIMCHFKRSTDHPFPWGNPEAEARLARLLELFPHVTDSPRCSRFWAYRFQFYRGLAIVEMKLASTKKAENALRALGPNARINLTVCSLEDWKSHPIMRYVEVLRPARVWG